MKCVHMADIHWRGLSRHNEYRKSFIKCFEQMNVIKPDVIYVGGDIVHSKTQGISPELIENLAWWFTELAKIAPTHVILGNHDGILTNDDRQDTITPVIEALNNPRIFLYKQSGLYPTGIPGFNWAVFSCFDEKSWKNVKPKSGDVNIALFHGAVWGSMTDADWKIEGETDVKFFDGYDFAMLGDIHKVQFLTKDKRIAYSGSVIQQNYGESIDKGFLVWDIRSRDDFDVNFHKVEPVHPYVTIDWKGSVTSTAEQVSNCPIGSRIRVRSNEAIHNVEWKQLKGELEKTFRAEEVVSKNELDVDVKKIKAGDVSLMKDDLRDPDTMINILNRYFEAEKVTKDEMKSLESIVRETVKIAAKDDDVTHGSKWSVKKLEFDNTFIYGANNVIDFHSMPGITGIFGKNAKGKSSIVGTLMYTLFNTTDRGAVKNLFVINARKNYCLSKATVEVNGETYRFERQTVKHEERDGTDGALTNLNILKVDREGNVVEDQSAEQRKVSEVVIRNKIGLAEDFLLTSLASQGDMNSFISRKNTARKAILTRFLGLDIFDRMSEHLRDESKILQAQMKKFPDRDWDSVIKDKHEEILSANDRIEKIQTLLASYRDEERNEQIKLHTNFPDTDKIVTQSDIDDKDEELEKMNGKFQNTINSIKVLNEEIEKINSSQKEIFESKSKIDINALRNSAISLRNIEKTLVNLKHAHEKELTTLKNQERSVEKLNDVPCDDLFPTCKFIKESHENKLKLNDQRKKVTDALSQIEELQRDIESLNSLDIDNQIDKFNTLTKKENVCSLMLVKKEADIIQCTANNEVLQTKLDTAKIELAQLKKKIISETANDEMTKLKQNIKVLRNKISEIDAEKLLHSSNVGQFTNAIESLESEKRIFVETKSKLKIYELLMGAVSKRGVPLQIIMSQLPAINAEISKILQNVVTFTVELEADINSNEMDVFINYGDSRRIIEVASGMEKMIASLAIRVALINVSSLPKTDMLIIDEGFGTLDDTNVEACNRLLLSLKKWFRSILIITHIDGVKDIVDNVIDITSEGLDARVTYE